MKNRRPINEDDILLTEMLIAQSYGNLKKSVVQASSETLGTLGGAVGSTVRKHPYATAGAAVGAGIVLFGLFKLLNREGSGKRGAEDRGQKSGMNMDILSILMPLVTPYLTAYLENYLGKMVSQDRKHR
jgi:hypothetical protein